MLHILYCISILYYVCLLGTKGNIKLKEPFWTALSVESPEGTKSWTLPAGDAKLQAAFNYGNGENMSFESQHVRLVNCLV